MSATRQVCPISSPKEIPHVHRAEGRWDGIDVPFDRLTSLGSSSGQTEDIAADGTVPVPDGPGLGVVYDWDFIEANRTALHTFTL